MNLEKLKNSIKIELHNKGVPDHDREDALADILCNYIAKGKGQTTGHAVIDWLRARYGDPRVKGRERRYLFEHPLQFEDDIPSKQDDASVYIDMIAVFNKAELNDIERLLFVLRYIAGFEVRHIAKILCCHERRVTYTFKSIRHKIMEASSE